MTAKERHYRTLIAKGFSEKDARRLGTGLFQLSGIRTASTFAAGLDKVGTMSDPTIRKHHLKKAKAAGVSTAGKVYMGSMATEPGDPKAWISEMDAESTIKKTCHEKGWGCEGSINIEPRAAESDPWENADNALQAEPCEA